MWSGGFAYGFFFKKGLYDPANLNNFISNWFTDREIKRHFSLGVENLMTGAFASFERQQPSDMVKLLQASVAFSGVIPPVEVFNQLYLAGSSIYENDVMTAIAHCEELGYE